MIGGIKMETNDSCFDRPPLPFMQASFDYMNSQAYIDCIDEEEMQAVACCERHYYRAEGEKCVALAKTLLASKSYSIRTSASLMFIFGSLGAGDPKSAMQLMMKIRQEYEMKIMQGIPRSDQEKLYAAFVSNLTSVLLHLTDMPFIDMDVKKLPGGIRLIALYVIAHHHYLKKEYGRVVGIVETSLSLSTTRYPIGEIYLHLIASVAYMNMEDDKHAQEHFFAAWQIAKPEGYIEPFAEHHGLLHGMVEVHLRKTEPEAYEKIIRQVYIFADAWRQVHNPETGNSIADNLTTLEFTIAMLASRGWSNKKIAAHVGVALSTVKTHMYTVYQKLGIKSRKELEQYMLK